MSMWIILSAFLFSKIKVSQTALSVMELNVLMLNG